MKPTRKMLGTLGAFTRERPEPTESEQEQARQDREREAAAPVKVVRAKLTPSELLERVADFAVTLSKMEQPPALGVRAKGTENVPSPELWKEVREQALQRIKVLHTRLKATLDEREKGPIAGPSIATAGTALNEQGFALALEQVSHTLEVRQPPKKEG